MGLDVPLGGMCLPGVGMRSAGAKKVVLEKPWEFSFSFGLKRILGGRGVFF